MLEPVNEREILIYAFDAQRASVIDRPQRDGLAVDIDLSRIRLVIAGQNLDQSRLAGAVIAENAERLAARHLHR